MSDKSSIRVLMFIGMLSVISACNNNGKQHETIKTGVQATLAETMDTFLAANLKDNAPGLIVSVWQNDMNLYTAMKGLAKLDEPITENTQFRLASVSKTFTAIAVLKLHEQGLVGLQDSILDYLPELDVSWQGITIHHLLSHRSGIPDIFNDLNAHDLISGDFTNQKIVKYFIDNPSLEFSAGSKEDYSNTGYILLAEIVSKVSGRAYADFMETEVFEPLNMNDTYILGDANGITPLTAMNFATTHKQFGRHVYTYGSAAQVSSMNDMQRFVYAFMMGEIIQPETKSLMLTSYSNGEETMFNGFGYGVIFYSEDGKTTYGHNGGGDGSRTIYAINRSKNSFIVILGNGGDNLPDYSYMLELAGNFLE